MKDVDTDLLELEFPDIDINDFDFFMVESETSNSPNVVILDTGAQLSVFNNRELLYDLHESKTTININWVCIPTIIFFPKY
jgi:hypothetical protein